MIFFSGAGLAQRVWDEWDALAMETVGERIQWMTGLGSTETGPFAMYCRPDACGSGIVGLPAPGVHGEGGAGGRQAGSARERAEYHAGLLARSRADRGAAR